MPDTLITLAPRPYWVAWQQEDRQSGKPTKVPYAPNGSKARANDPSTWGDRLAAEARAALLPKPYGLGGVGLELCSLGDGRSIGGIDLDTCRDPDTGNFEAFAEDIMASFDSYAEISPSSTGAKVFFTYETDALPIIRRSMGEAEFSKSFTGGSGEHPPAIEVHLGNRYFAVTDEHIATTATDLRHVDAERIIRLIAEEGPAFAAMAAKPAGQASTGKTASTRSRSELAFRVGKQAVRDGATFDQMCELLRQNPDTADWMREKGEANRYREAKRIFEKAQADGPIIRVVAGELHKTASAAENAITSANLTIYQRGQTLVRPIMQEVPATKGRMTHTASFSEMTPHSFIDELCGCATWERFDARAEDWVRINPPRSVADIIMSRVGLWTFPKVVGVITTPTIRPDGSILSAPGYDPATRLYHFADPDLKLTPSVENPSRRNAEAALACLSELLAEFPFANGVSKAVALSALITPTVRGALTVAPLHLIRANAPGTGKSYVVDVASAIAAGRACPVAAAGADEAETEKRLAGLLLSGFPLVSLDNVNGELGGDLLCQAIERPLVRIRRLGSSDITEIETRATIFATGNAARVRGDMTRRSVIADLDAQMERPELRQFKGDPVATVMAERGRYVSACLVVVRAYQLAGCPDALPSLASFDDWSKLVRSALVWLGCDDPAKSMETAREDDPELSELREVIAVWADAFGAGDAMTVKAVADAADLRKMEEHGYGGSEFRNPELRDVLLKLAGERGAISTRRLGSWLTRREGRIASKHRFERDRTAGHGGVVRWKLARV